MHKQGGKWGKGLRKIDKWLFLWGCKTTLGRGMFCGSGGGSMNGEKRNWDGIRNRIKGESLGWW